MSGEETPREGASGARWSIAADPPTARADVLRYALSALLVAGAFTALAAGLGHAPRSEPASDVDNAVMVELPPAESSSSRPADDDGPERQAVPATVAQAAPDAVPQTPAEPPKVESPPIETPPQLPPPPVAPAPDAAVTPNVAPPPKPVAAPPAPQAAPQADTAPNGSDARAVPDVDGANEIIPHASARMITLWQRSLMQRLETAKRALGHATHGLGSVSIAFAIDERGRLVSERVARSSGSTTLDRTALALVDRAAPFPAPPRGAVTQDLSFVVPVVFKR